MTHRVLRTVVSIALSLVVMGVLAYALGQATRSEWVWWLAPLTVAFDGSLPFRARIRGGDALRSLSELAIFRDPGVSVYLVSSMVPAGIVALGAYTGNRVALIIGAAFAILGRALERGE